MTDEVAVCACAIAPELIERARANGAAVVILPLSQADDGRGIYGESTLFLGKELRAGGLEADYLDEAGKRLFEAKKGLIVEGLLTVSLGVVSAAAWDGIKALLRRATLDKATLDVTYVDLSPEGRCRTWNVRGDRDGALDAIDRLLDQSPGEEP